MKITSPALRLAAAGLILTILASGCAQPETEPAPTDQPPTLPAATIVVNTPAPADELSSGAMPTAVPRPEGSLIAIIQSPNGEEIPLTINYIVDLPPGYEEDSTQEYALLVHLHGAGVTGGDIERLRMLHRSDVLIEAYETFPIIVLYPQLPSPFMPWRMIGEQVMQIVDETLETYPIDPQRVYLTGYSDGGFGVYGIGEQFPDRFAAVASVAGYYDGILETVCNLNTTPVTLYHGMLDEVVPVTASTAIFEQLTACGGNALLVVYSNLDHSTLPGEVYNDLDFYEWLFEHKLP